jgi:very-short-patch-repair endonuclease
MAAKESERVPKELSVGEETFAVQCGYYKLRPEREYVFHPKRRWRFDFAFPDRKLAVEVEGGMGGRHQRRAGFEGDAYKYNDAAKLGWFVLRYTTAMVTRGDAIDDVREMLK